MDSDSRLTTTVGAWFASIGADGLRRVGCAVLRPRARASKADAQTRRLELYAFLDTERWAHTETLAVQCGAAHLYLGLEGLPEGEARKVEGLLAALAGDEGSGGPSLERAARAAFLGEAEAAAALRRLAGAGGLPAAAEGLPLALRAAGALVSRGKLLALADAAAEGGEGAPGTYELACCSLDAFMRLDAAAVRALNLLPATGRDAAAAAVVESSAQGYAAAGSSGGGGGGGGGGGSAPPGASPAAGSSVVSSSSSSSSSSSAQPAAATPRLGSGAVTSLLGLLSKGCRTKGGGRLLKTWILQPLVSREAILARQAMVEAFASSASLRTAWDAAVSVSDLETLAARFSRKSADLKDMLRLYSFATQLRAIVRVLREHLDSEAGGGGAGGGAGGEGVEGGEEGEGGEGEGGGAADAGLSPVLRRFKQSFVLPLERHGRDFGLYQEMIEALVVDVADLAQPRVLPSYSPELGALEERRKGLRGELEALHERALESDWGADMGLKLLDDRAKGWVWRARKDCEKAVRGVPGVASGDITVLKDGIYFSTARLGRLSDAMREVEDAYRTEQKAVVEQALGVARTYSAVLEASAALVGELDAYKGMAHAAACGAGEYVKPVVLEVGGGGGGGGSSGRRLRVEAGRHPVMELQDDVSFIPNDYAMDGEGEDVEEEAREAAGGGSKRARVGGEGEGAGSGAGAAAPGPGGRYHIITGPNMGGKSTYIRTLGVLVVMAQVRGGGGRWFRRHCTPLCSPFPLHALVPPPSLRWAPTCPPAPWSSRPLTPCARAWARATTPSRACPPSWPRCWRRAPSWPPPRLPRW